MGDFSSERLNRRYTDIAGVCVHGSVPVAFVQVAFVGHVHCPPSSKTQFQNWAIERSGKKCIGIASLNRVSIRTVMASAQTALLGSFEMLSSMDDAIEQVSPASERRRARRRNTPSLRGCCRMSMDRRKTKA